MPFKLLENLTVPYLRATTSKDLSTPLPAARLGCSTEGRAAARPPRPTPQRRAESPSNLGSPTHSVARNSVCTRPCTLSRVGDPSVGWFVVITNIDSQGSDRSALRTWPDCPLNPNTRLILSNLGHCPASVTAACFQWHSNVEAGHCGQLMPSVGSTRSGRGRRARRAALPSDLERATGQLESY